MFQSFLVEFNSEFFVFLCFICCSQNHESLCLKKGFTFSGQKCVLTWDYFFFENFNARGNIIASVKSLSSEQFKFETCIGQIVSFKKSYTPLIFFVAHKTVSKIVHSMLECKLDLIRLLSLCLVILGRIRSFRRQILHVYIVLA